MWHSSIRMSSWFFCGVEEHRRGRLCHKCSTQRKTPNWVSGVSFRFPPLLLRVFSGCDLGLRNGPALFAYFETGEAADGDILAQLADFCGDQLRDADGLLLDEWLIEQTHFFVEFRHLAFDDFLDYGRGFAGCCRLRTIDFLLALEVFGCDVFATNVFRVGGRDVHGDVVQQFLEVFGAGDEIALAVQLKQHADFASGMDVAGDRSLIGAARGLLARRGNTFLTQDDYRLLDVTIGFGERVLAVPKWSAGFIAQLLHHFRVDVHGSSAHFNLCFLPVQVRPYE